MSKALLEGLATSLVFLGTVVDADIERSRLVKARVHITTEGRAFCHHVSVTNNDPSRRVVVVLVGHLPGLREEPKSVRVPTGWQSQIFRREVRGVVKWAVQCACVAPDSPPNAAVSKQGAKACGLRTGDTVRFDVVLQYESASLTTEPIYVRFSDGKTELAGK